MPAQWRGEGVVFLGPLRRSFYYLILSRLFHLINDFIPQASTLLYTTVPERDDR